MSVSIRILFLSSLLAANLFAMEMNTQDPMTTHGQDETSVASLQDGTYCSVSVPCPDGSIESCTAQGNRTHCQQFTYRVRCEAWRLLKHSVSEGRCPGTN